MDAQETTTFLKSELQRIKKRFYYFIEFFTDPFTGSKDILDEIDIKQLVAIEADKNNQLLLPNHSVEEGQIRINVLIWNEIANYVAGNQLIISTHSLDSNLYSHKAIEGIKELFQKNATIKILYKKDSQNVKDLKESFGEASDNFIRKVSSENSPTIKNFIIGSYGISIEKKQIYKNNALIEHEATFLYNPEKSGNVQNNANSLKQDFDNNWN